MVCAVLTALCVVCERKEKQYESINTLSTSRYRRSAHRAPRPTSGLRAYRYRGHPLKREISTFCLSP